MAKTKGRPKSKRDDATTKIDRRLLGIAHLIARERGISTAELLSEIVRGPLEKAHEQLVRKFDKRETND